MVNVVLPADKSIVLGKPMDTLQDRTRRFTLPTPVGASVDPERTGCNVAECKGGGPAPYRQLPTLKPA